MTPEQFSYWLQGYSEVCGETPTEQQWKIIQDHLKTVFQKVTPAYNNIAGQQYSGQVTKSQEYQPKAIC